MKAKTERNNETPSCAAVAPLLTALFDGEADMQSAHSARAHLLSCERCARTWLDWNQHRAILRNESVPAPPPTLLWRVLLACRLANFSRGKKAVPGVESSLRGATLFPDAGLPADLNARILAQTTRRVQPALSGYHSSQETKRTRWRMASWPAFAMPALAAWVIFVGQPALFFPTETASVDDAGVTLSSPSSRVKVTLPDRTVTSVPQVAAARTTRDVRHHISVSPLAKTAVVKQRLQASVLLNAPRSMVATAAPRVGPTEPHAVVTRSTVNRVVRYDNVTRVARLTRARVEADLREGHPENQLQRPIESVQVALATPHVPAQRVETASLAAKASTRPVLVGTPVVAPRLAPVRVASIHSRFRVAALSNEIETPRPRVARPLLARLSHDDPTTLRSSRPASAPRVSATRFASLDTTEEHVEDVQSVVDDFRSAFSNDENIDTLDSNAS